MSWIIFMTDVNLVTHGYVWANTHLMISKSSSFKLRFRTRNPHDMLFGVIWYDAATTPVYDMTTYRMNVYVSIQCKRCRSILLIPTWSTLHFVCLRLTGWSARPRFPAIPSIIVYPGKFTNKTSWVYLGWYRVMDLRIIMIGNLTPRAGIYVMDA